MLTLMLLRHAKAVQQDPAGDVARALAERGRDDARRLGGYLGEQSWWPDLALVSSAVRTTQTYEIVAQAAPRPPAARFEPSLYNATAAELRDVLRLIDPTVARLMIVGHNPGLAEAAALLSRDGDPLDLGRLRNRFPPCALAVLSFDATDWRDARASGGRLDLVLLPEDLVAPG